MRDLRALNEQVDQQAAQLVELRQVVAKLVEDNARTTGALLQLQQQRGDAVDDEDDAAP